MTFVRRGGWRFFHKDWMRAGLEKLHVSPAGMWIKLSGLAAAPFIFFAAAAGAGIVASDFGAGANGLGSFGLRRARLILELLLLALLAALDFALLILRLGGLNEEKIARGFSVNAGHHFFKKREGFFFELDQWIFLAV